MHVMDPTGVARISPIGPKSWSGMANRRILTQRTISLLGFAVALAFVAVRWWDPTVLQIVRHKGFDVYQRVHAPVPSRWPVVIVAIDAASLAAQGGWPWPRTLLAELADAAGKAGATAIGFDMVLSETDRTGTDPTAMTPADESLSARRRAILPGGDGVLAARLAMLPSVLGQTPVTDATTAGASSWPMKAPLVVAGPDPGEFVPRYAGWARNVAALEDAARGLGTLALDPDADGIVRRPPLLAASQQGRLYPSLALEALRVALGAAALEVRTTDDGVTSIKVGPLIVPTDRRGRLWLRALPSSAIPTVSADALLRGDAVARAAVQGRIALVGVSAPGLADVKPSARGALTSTQAQAIAIATMTAGDFPHRPAWTANVEMVAVAIIGAMLAVALPARGLGWAAATAGLLAGGYTLVSWVLFRRQGILLDASHAIISTIYLFLILVAAEQMRERGRRRDIKNAFAQYLAPALVDRLADRPDPPELRGQRRTMTFLFGDIRGFTAIAERFADDPASLTRLINQFLTAMGDRLMEHGATIDKYMGDAVMAFWNAPLEDPDHALHGCLAALEMIDGLKKLNPKLREDPALAPMLGEGLEIGIGINTGPCLVGNVGSAHRFNYSVIGDAVNVAARLEHETRAYGVRILVGEATREAAQGLAFLEVDTLRIRGRGEPERAFALLGGQDLARNPRYGALETAQGAFLAALQAGEHAEAWRRLAACRAAAAALADDFAAYDVDLEALFALYARRLEGRPAAAQGIAGTG